MIGPLAHAGDLPVYLSCLSRTLMRRWVDAMTEQPGIELSGRVGELGTPDEDISAGSTARSTCGAGAAIALHRSQTSPYEGLPPDLRRAFLTTEYLVGPVPSTARP